MAIRIKVSEFLGRYKMTQKDLSEKTGIRANTVSAFYYETIKRLDVKHLDKLCEVFNCQPGDLLEYIPPDKGTHVLRETNKLFTIYEAAAILEVSKDTIRRRIKKGVLTAIKDEGPYGSQYFIPESEIYKFQKTT